MNTPNPSPMDLAISPTVSDGHAENDDQQSDTFQLTQVPSAASGQSGAAVFSVPEYAASSPTTNNLPFTSTFFPSRSVRAALPQVTNVLSPVQSVINIGDGQVHSLRTGQSEEHRPTILQPISSIVRSFTGDPLATVSTALVARPGNESEKVMRQLASNLAAADEEIHHLLTPEQANKRRVAEAALLADDPFSFLRATQGPNKDTPRLSYSRKRTEKSELASKIMMSFSHDDMQNISEEIVRNGGEMTCADFIRTTRRKQQGDQDYAAETEALQEMFQEIDVNGDFSLSFLEVGEQNISEQAK